MPFVAFKSSDETNVGDVPLVLPVKLADTLSPRLLHR